MAENDIYIEGSSYGQWATEQTVNGILNAASTNNRLSGQQNQILLKILEASAKKLPIDFGPLVAEAKKQSMAAKEQADAATKAADEAAKANKESKKSTDKAENQGDAMVQRLSGMQRLFAEFKNNTLKPNELRRYNQELLDKTDEQNKLTKDLVDQREKLGLRPSEEQGRLAGLAAGGYNAYQSISEGIGGNVLDGLGDILKGDLLSGGAAIGSAAIGAVMGAREYSLGQIEGRYDLANELRQSGLLSALGEVQQSFTDIAKTVNDSNMTLQEAAEFTRQFGRSVGVIGVTESLRFVNEMAYSRDMMGQYGMSFSQIATVSGTYLDTLERLGMLETINASSRDRGMNSFMSAVQSTAQTLKVSMEESAKMISEYLGRDDISAMIMTAAGGLSQEMQAQIGQMGNMGPLGEIIAMGAIDPTRFMLTDEYQAMMNPALSGVRGIIEQMQTELAMGGNAADITARYSQQLANIVRNDPVVAQLVATDDEVAKLVSGISRFAQNAEDAITSPDFTQGSLEADSLERKRQDLQRQRDVAFEAAISNTLDHMQDSGELVRLLNTEVDLMKSQINAITTATDAFENLISGVLTASISTVNSVTSMLLDSATGLINMINSETGGVTSSIYANQISDTVKDTIDDQLFAWINGMDASEVSDFLSANPAIANNVNARKYMIARNNELLGNSTVGQDMPLDFQSMIYGNRYSMRPEEFSRYASDMLITKTEDILSNGLMGIDAAGNIDRISAEEFAAFNDTIETLRDENLGLTPEQIRTIINETMATLRTDQQNTTDESTRADIARLIASLNSFVNAVN